MPDQEPPVQRPVARRVDESAADTGTLAEMGVVPAPRAPVAPTPPGPPPEPPGQAENRATLDAALAEAGVEKTTADTAAVRSLSTLDAATVQTVARWVKRGKRDTVPST